MATNKLLLSQTLTHKENTMSFETPKLPEVKFNKNGYEIRTDILDMAKGLVSEEFHAKFQGWEMSTARDEKTGKLVTTVGMPEFPGLDKVLETAEKMYSFVNQGATSTKK
jgi:hypothetical protein